VTFGAAAALALSARRTSIARICDRLGRCEPRLLLRAVDDRLWRLEVDSGIGGEWSFIW
jgi:hypothetical protein